VVEAGPEIDDPVLTRSIGDCGANSLDERVACRFDGNAGHHRAGCVTNSTCENPLSCSERRYEYRCRRHDETLPRSTHTVAPSLLNRAPMPPFVTAASENCETVLQIDENLPVVWAAILDDTRARVNSGFHGFF